MVKSRSRSPRWRPGSPSHKSLEYNRHDYDHNNHGFHRNERRPLQWDNERHRMNSSRNDTFNSFNKMHEQDFIDSEYKRSPFKVTNYRRYSPERQEKSNRRYHDVPDYIEHSRNFRDDQVHERNMHNNNEFKTVRRWGSFHRPHNTDRDWHENDGHWSERDHSNQYWSPPRRPDFEERKPFQKRYPEDDYREYDQPYKRLREADRHNLQPHRSPYWKDDHPDEPYGKGWTKEFDHRHSNFILHERQSEHVAKIESDYRHRSPRYIRAEPVFSDDHVSRSKLHEEQKLSHARTSQSHKTDRDDHERRRYNERSSQPLSKCSSRKDNGGNGVKSDTDIKHQNHKNKDKGKKEEECWRKKDESRKDPVSSKHLRPQNSDSKVASKINPEKKAMDNFGLKNSTDTYRLPGKHKNTTKDFPPKSEAIKGPRISEGKQVSGDDLTKRNDSGSTLKDRQTSQDLAIVAGKGRFYQVFGHLQKSVHSDNNAPATEFTQEIITIIHEVKANHFKASGMSLHERFSKMQTESNTQELNFDKPPLQINPEIHRRIDISLEDLKKKSLHKTVDIQSVKHKIIEDPNDLRHDIERRRKERLHSNKDESPNDHFDKSDASSGYYELQSREDTECHSSSKERRPPFEDSTGRRPETGSYYRGESKQYYSSRSNFEVPNESRRPYKGNLVQPKNSSRDYFQKDAPTTTNWGNSLQPKNTLRDYFQKTMVTSTSLVHLESLREEVTLLQESNLFPRYHSR